MTTVSSPEEVCNLALDAIGYPQVIGSLLTDGTQVSRIGLRIYSQTRDELLNDLDWGFARQTVVMTLLKTAPVTGYGILQPWNTTFPPIPWIYEYAYPANCITMRSVRPAPLGLMEYDPKPNIFVIANDQALNAKVVLTNLANATAVYTGQVVDANQWDDSLFVDALVQRLARKFAPALAMKQNAQQVEIAEAGQAKALANAGTRAE